MRRDDPAFDCLVGEIVEAISDGGRTYPDFGLFWDLKQTDRELALVESCTTSPRIVSLFAADEWVPSSDR